MEKYLASTVSWGIMWCLHWISPINSILLPALSCWLFNSAFSQLYLRWLSWLIVSHCCWLLLTDIGFRGIVSRLYPTEQLWNPATREKKQHYHQRGTVLLDYNLFNTGILYSDYSQSQSTQTIHLMEMKSTYRYTKKISNFKVLLITLDSVL